MSSDRYCIVFGKFTKVQRLKESAPRNQSVGRAVWREETIKLLAAKGRWKGDSAGIYENLCIAEAIM